jgi:serine/threonine protein kinase
VLNVEASHNAMADDEPFPESIENAWGSDHVNIEKGGDYIIEDEKRLPFIYRKVLGNGLSAVVEKVQHTITKEVFAKKVIKLPRLKSKGRESAEEHYQNEVAIIRGLSQHSHIIELFATYMTPRSGVLLLRPAAEEGDLQQYLDRYTDAVDRVTTEPVDLESMASVLERAFGCLSNGLAYMHSKGIRHKDIKPGNILIHQGIPIYTDFGASKDTKKDGQCTTEGRPESLTRRFCAPEVLEYDKRNFAADVYSLGCVFVEMLVRLSHLTEHDDLEEEGYAGIMESLHAILPSAKISPKVACLLDLILLMTLREPSRRPDSETLATNICCHEGLSCLQCHSVRLDSRPQPQSRSQSGPQWSPQFQRYLHTVWNAQYKRYHYTHYVEGWYLFHQEVPQLTIAKGRDGYISSGYLSSTMFSNRFSRQLHNTSSLLILNTYNSHNCRAISLASILRNTASRLYTLIALVVTLRHNKLARLL